MLQPSMYISSYSHHPCVEKKLRSEQSTRNFISDIILINRNIIVSEISVRVWGVSFRPRWGAHRKGSYRDFQPNPLREIICLKWSNIELYLHKQTKNYPFPLIAFAHSSLYIQKLLSQSVADLGRARYSQVQGMLAKIVNFGPKFPIIRSYKYLVWGKCVMNHDS